MKLPIEELPETQFAEFGQYSLNWREAGNGAPVILLHGISSGSASWLCQLTDSSLTKGHRLIAWDAPGYLNSAQLATNTPVALDFADALDAFLNGLGLQQVTLVGHSLGALMVCAFASIHPQRVNGLFLANPAQGYAAKHLEERNRIFEQRRDIVFNSGIEAYAQNRAAALLSLSASKEKVEWVRKNMQKLNPDGFLAAAWMLAHDDIGLYLNAYQGEIKMVVGFEDTITPPKQVQQLAAQKQSPLAVIKQAGHASYLDAPDEFNGHLKQFLMTLNSDVSQRKVP
ncbi:MAG: alpha/beta hydrolase [Providencia heimbachae]|nr:alpha/beta hydrolase [Providencia heimbachae]